MLSRSLADGSSSGNLNEQCGTLTVKKNGDQHTEEIIRLDVLVTQSALAESQTTIDVTSSIVCLLSQNHFWPSLCLRYMDSSIHAVWIFSTSSQSEVWTERRSQIARGWFSTTDTKGRHTLMTRPPVSNVPLNDIRKRLLSYLTTLRRYLPSIISAFSSSVRR